MGLSELQNFDYLVIAMLLSSIYVGWRNGLIVSLIAFFAWIGSAIIVFDSYESLFNIITPYIHSKFISGFIASIGFYIILVIALTPVMALVGVTPSMIEPQNQRRIKYYNMV